MLDEIKKTDEQVQREANKWVKQQYDRHIKHNFKWLNSNTVEKYYKKFADSNKSAAIQRQLLDELMNIYGVTDLEAINILRGTNTGDYINKYERIRTLRPVKHERKKGF